MGALRGPHKRAKAPKRPQVAPKRLKMVKKDYIPGGPKKEKRLNGNSHSTFILFLDHAVYVSAYPDFQGEGTKSTETATVQDEERQVKRMLL